MYLPACTFGGVYVPCIYQPVPLVEFMYPVFTSMYLWWSLCTLYLPACQVELLLAK